MFCPMRTVRPMACFSKVAFSAGSSRYTWVATVRVMPALAALQVLKSNVKEADHCRRWPRGTPSRWG